MEKNIYFTLGQLSILFLAITFVSGKLTPNYDDGDHYKLYKLGKNLTLQCKPDNKEDGAKIVWTKEGQEVTKIAGLTGLFDIKEKEGIFRINKAREEDAGNYSCTLGSETHDFDVWAKVVVRMPKSSYVVENEKLEIICIAKGTSPKISWKFINDTEANENTDFNELNPDDTRYQFLPHDDIENSKFVITNALMSDRGSYKCTGSSDLMEKRDDDDDFDPEDLNQSYSIGTVRVKDKLAALWPFLGICAEVFLLCTIILIYEKRRNKTDLDESDTDSPDQKK